MTMNALSKGVAEDQRVNVRERVEPDYHRFPPGWWIIPSVVLGLVGWVVIIRALFHLFA